MPPPPPAATQAGTPLRAAGAWAFLRGAWQRGAPLQRRLWLGTLSLMALAWLVLAMEWRHDWHQTREQQFAQLHRTTRVFAEDVLHSFNAADQITWAIQRDADQGRLLADLRDYIPPFAEVQNLIGKVSLIDPAGWLINASVPWQRINLSDQEYWQVHVNGTHQQVYISRPLIDRTTGEQVVYLSRRLGRPGMPFAGVVAVALQPRHFERLFNELGSLKDRLFTLIGRDGVVRARESEPRSAIGQDLASSAEAMAPLLANDTGLIESVSPIDGERRWLAHRALPDYPLIVVAGLPMQTLGTLLWDHLWFDATLALTFTLVMGLAAWRFHVHDQERNQRAQALEITSRRLQRQDDVKSTLLNALSHELCPPLQQLANITQRMVEGPSERLRQDAAHHAQRLSAELAQGVGHVIELARLELGLQRPHWGPVNLGELLRQLVHTHSHAPATRERQVQALLEARPEHLASAHLVSDANWLASTLDRLVSKAVRHSPQGGVVRVSTTPRTASSGWQVDIEDQGSGLPPLDVPHLFHRTWHTPDGHHALVPSGAALSLTLTTLELLGAQIHVHSVPGNGTHYTLLFDAPPTNPSPSPTAAVQAATGHWLDEVEGLPTQ